jgi:hypothetical protein
MAVDWRQASIFDQSGWMNLPAYAVAVGAEHVARALGWLHEQTFDDFDYFQIVIAESGSKKIAIQSWPRGPGSGSDVFLNESANLDDLHDLLTSRDGRLIYQIYDLSGDRIT